MPILPVLIGGSRGRIWPVKYDVVVEIARPELVAAVRATIPLSDIPRTWKPAPAGEVARTVHVGPYDRLGNAHHAIHTWCAANNRKIARASWETYGDWTEDPALLETTIKYLLT